MLRYEWMRRRSTPSAVWLWGLELSKGWARATVAERFGCSKHVVKHRGVEAGRASHSIVGFLLGVTREALWT
jgi:hypothetical protein